jgi:endo-1,3(4)-beta-glucanase
MKALVWLTVLQMATARALPKPQDCIEPTLPSDNNVVIAPAATSTIAPEPTVDAGLSTTAGVVVVTTVVHETHNGDVFVPYPLDPVPITSQTVSATRDQITLTSTSPSLGGIFFDPVSTSSVSASVPILTTSASSGTAQILPSLSTQIPQTTGVVVTSLNTTGLPTSAPIISTSISKPETTLTPTAPATSVTTTVSQGSTSDNIFQPVATDAPPSVIGSRSDHPVPRLGIQPQDAPIGTNKFYANFFLGSQTSGTWTHPYSVAWSKGGGSSQSWGMSIQHIDANQRVFGPDAAAVPVQYMINPIGIQSLVLSALELGASTVLTTDTLTAFSANVNLSPSAGAPPAITFPLVQGMGFVTGIYNGGTPLLQTGIFFRSITKATTNPKPGVTKYTLLLEDGKTWLLYASSSDVNAALEFKVVNNGLAQATSNFNGFIQIAKNPGGDAEALYDAACGVYATTATLSGTANGASGSYTLSFSKAGTSGATLLMFALPHHVESFFSQTASAATNLQLQTTTKGLATAVVADAWTMVENLPTTMGFAPWSPSAGAEPLAFSAATIQTILSVAQSEISENMSDQSNLSSMYFSGKVSILLLSTFKLANFFQALAKFAGIVYTIHDLLGDTALAQAGLTNLKQAFALFSNNQQQFPLVYDAAWGGVVSSASYVTGQSGADFGNTYYNDHHFQYYP